MTVTLQTLNRGGILTQCEGLVGVIARQHHLGEIKAGFPGINVEEITIGDYLIPTDEFCGCVVELTAGRNSHSRTTRGGDIELSWNPERQVIKVGKYDIGAYEFELFVEYVFKGGSQGWTSHQPVGWKPDFVKSAIQYMREHMGKAPNSYRTKFHLSL